MSDRRLATLVFGFVLAIYLPLLPGRLDFFDGEARFFMTEALVEDHRLVTRGWRNVVGADGRRYGWFGVGQPIVAIPFYLAGRAVARRMGLPELDVERVAVSLVNPVVSALTAALLMLLCRRLGASRRASVGAALIWALASFAMPHARSTFEHPLEALAFVGVLHALARPAWPGVGGPVGAGLCIGLAVLMRMNAALLGVAYAAGRLLYSRHDWRHALRDVALAALVVLPFLELSMLTYQVRFGQLTPPADTPAFETPFGHGLRGLLLSPGKSLFLYSPTLVLAPFGLRALWVRARPVLLAVVALWVLYLLFFAHLTFWHGDWTWGPRYLLVLVAAAVPPTACALDRVQTRRARAAVTAVVLAALWVNAGAVLVNYQRHYFQQNYEGWFYLQDESLYFLPSMSPILAQWQQLPEVWRAMRARRWVEVQSPTESDVGPRRGFTGRDKVRREERYQVLDVWPVHAWILAPRARPWVVGSVGGLVLAAVALGDGLRRGLRKAEEAGARGVG